jgi:hypothetical protein
MFIFTKKPKYCISIIAICGVILCWNGGKEGYDLLAKNANEGF